MPPRRAMPAASSFNNAVMGDADSGMEQAWQRRDSLLQSWSPRRRRQNPGEFHIMLDIAFAKPALPKSGALVLLIGEGEMPSGVWQQADEATGGAIGRALQGGGIQGGEGQDMHDPRAGRGLVARSGRWSRQAGGTDRARAERGWGPRRGRGPARTCRIRRDRRTAARAGGRGGARCHAARLSLRQIPHKGKSRGQAEAHEAHVAHRRSGARQVGMGAVARRGEGRVPGARSGQRAAQRAEPGGDGGSLQEAERTRTEGRGAGPSRDEPAGFRRVARRRARQRE